jgi:predicted transposase YbfD/YdcC
LCGANDWNEIEEFGNNQLEWLRKFGEFKHGVPAHDTINRVFSAINPDEFNLCFNRLTQRVPKSSEKEIVAIDGKTICNSACKLKNLPAIHMVSAFAKSRGITLGQIAVSEKSNEITAIPKLLALLDIEDAIVTIDAMGCQKEIAQQVITNKADYILAVKGNQPSLQEAIEDTVRFEKPCDFNTQTDIGHGRIETRSCSIYRNLALIENSSQWTGLQTIIKIESQRVFKSTGAKTNQVRYYISSIEGSAEQFNAWIRSHWAIENNLHWMLDVNFREDYSTKQKANAAQNFNIISKMALYLLGNKTSGSIKQNRLKAALNIKYRENLLNF